MRIQYKIVIPVCLLLFASCTNHETRKINAEKPLFYSENWDSLASHNEEPDWLKDAKFGIYFHWGVYSVPAFEGAWYPRGMHFEGSSQYQHHIENYGHPSDFAYHDFIPMFRAEYFNAEDWAKLFVQAGAKFAGPVVEHHDGYSMWNSSITPWNVSETGPKRDVTGELEQAIKSAGLKFITTFHHARNLQRYQETQGEKHFQNSHYPYLMNMPTSSADHDLKYLYGNIPEEQWLEEVWYGKLKEVVDQYQPDIVWFDSWLDEIPEEYRLKFCTFFLNNAHTQNKEVCIVRKQDDLPLTCSIDDLEKSRMNRMNDHLWMTDETLSTEWWSYTTGMDLKPPADLIHILVDIVSKNGVLLLNISPKANGIIPDDQRETLLEMGDWLSKNGEAIYGSRPWYTYGEGPTKEPEGSFENHEEFLKIRYNADDIRYTSNGKNIYAITLGKPSPGKTLVLSAFSEENWSEKQDILSVKKLDNSEELNWVLTSEGLSIIAPAISDEMACVVKIELAETDEINGI